MTTLTEQNERLVIIPTFMRTPHELEVTLKTIESIRRTEPGDDYLVEILVVDDCSPVPELAEALMSFRDEHCFRMLVQPENEGFSRTVNVGLREATERGMDAVLMNADIECLTPGWFRRMQEQVDTQGRPASMVGALLMYPLGLIQHAGIFFSFLTRTFDHRYRFGPGLLPEAHMRCLCPVTGAFQFIRHECLTGVGLYDEDFRMGYEDVDYCLRVFESGRECIYLPTVQAIHHESLFRGNKADEKLNKWQSESLQLLMKKHRTTNMSRWMIEIV